LTPNQTKNLIFITLNYAQLCIAKHTILVIIVNTNIVQFLLLSRMETYPWNIYLYYFWIRRYANFKTKKCLLCPPRFCVM